MSPYTVATARARVDVANPTAASRRQRLRLRPRVGRRRRRRDAPAIRMPGPPAASPNYQRFTAGMRKRFWNRNCIALGLAGGFIEPLESTSINLVHRALSVFMDYYLGPDVDPRRAASSQPPVRARAKAHSRFHHPALQAIASFRHAVLAIGDRDAGPGFAARRIDTYRTCGALLRFDAESFKPESWLTMFEGFGVAQESYDSRVNDIDLARMLGALDVIRTSVERAAAGAMRHADFVARFCPATSAA